MKLYASTASPYVRKVLVVAHETGLVDQLELRPARMTPVTPDSELNSDNPLGKIPCLITADAGALYDSRVVCEYLDTRAGAGLFPAAGAARWTALRRQALGDGMLDAAVGARYESALRPESLRWREWIDGLVAKFVRGVDALEAEAGSLGDTVDIGTITIGCALGYLDFRYADSGWRRGHDRLAQWYARFAERPSMRATMPRDIA
ncbi:MAG: glutathione S-transferase [Ectothiorhodospiraceae bacterium]|nr:glutathione S-transferase [Ectothiorhodospiraceae bacterium]